MDAEALRGISSRPLFACALSAALLAGGALAADQPFRRGDVNVDGAVDIGDVYVQVFFPAAFGPGPPFRCLDALDLNDDGTINITDPIYLLNFLFLGGPEPPAPGPDEPGPDPTADSLDCFAYSPEPVPSTGDFVLGFRSPVVVLAGIPRNFEGEAVATLVSDSENPYGAEGWSFGLRLQGAGLRIVDVTTDGTVSAHKPEGRVSNSGFSHVESISPEMDTGAGPQGPGVVSAVMLDFLRPNALEPGTTHPIARIALEGFSNEAPPVDAVGSLRYIDGLVGSGRPVMNRIYYDDGPQIPATEDAEILLRIVDSWQRPGDCSQDGVLDISDAICVLGHLFLGGPAPIVCNDGAVGPGALELLDSNGDGTFDISDSVYVLGYLFLGSEPPFLGAECVAAPRCAHTCSR